MLKKLLAILAVLGATVTLQANEEAEISQFEPFTGKIIGSKVRLRTSPTLEAHVVRETTKGELFAFTDQVEGFYAISPPEGTKGYVFRTFVLDNVIEGERVNVRLYPDMEAPVVAQLNTGDRVNAIVSDVNSKWLVIDLPETCHFYVAKEFVEKQGPVGMIAELQKRHHEASHHLSSAFLFAQAEIQKPFALIDFDTISLKFAELMNSYADLEDIVHQAEEANSVLQDVYIQKKIAFLEAQSEKNPRPFEIAPGHLERLAKLGIDLQPVQQQVTSVSKIATAATGTVGLASTLADQEISEKMLVWKPLEESLFHLWAAAHGEGSMEEFYQDENTLAEPLIGVIEPYTRPVKNRPGDYVLREDNRPVAFLYSTKVDLQKLIGQKVMLMGAPRPNNNFAFPAYFVLSVE